MNNNNIWGQAPLPTAPVVSTLGSKFAHKRAGKKTSHVVFVLDDSASMRSSREATISGYNEYLKRQKKDAKESNIKTYVSLYKFDGYNVTCVFDRVNIKKVNKLTKDDYNPNGMTNLYDAIGGVMLRINEVLSGSKKSNRDSIIITILTDGHENASRTFNAINVKQMVEKAEGKNWGFMFLGANIDAFAAGSVLGFGVNNTIQYGMNNIENTINLASDMTSRMKSAYSRGIDTTVAYASAGFTEDERSLATGEDND